MRGVNVCVCVSVGTPVFSLLPCTKGISSSSTRGTVYCPRDQMSGIREKIGGREGGRSQSTHTHNHSRTHHTRFRRDASQRASERSNKCGYRLAGGEGVTERGSRSRIAPLLSSCTPPWYHTQTNRDVVRVACRPRVHCWPKSSGGCCSCLFVCLFVYLFVFII